MTNPIARSLLVLSVLFGLAGAAVAQTAPPPEHRHHGPHACRPDIEKFCADTKPGDGRIIACLNSHKTDLTPACAAGLDKYEEKESEKK